VNPTEELPAVHITCGARTIAELYERNAELVRQRDSARDAAALLEAQLAEVERRLDDAAAEASRQFETACNMPQALDVGAVDFIDGCRVQAAEALLVLREVTDPYPQEAVE
jgi:hypothetical protein